MTGNCCDEVFKKAENELYIGNFLYRFRPFNIFFKRMLFLKSFKSCRHILLPRKNIDIIWPRITE
ncbi:hypothetical protein DSCW_06950 [Desulfosarcina widdelii]|uniref:Uncharacterized protein n=1 Tax=Desulfosarcina widdelii TaxID=947919 RepID=A0A5K7YXE1_9BACT|nr:hypothetical protein DSCW_06950 [Desulfosarcina widdelii]